MSVGRSEESGCCRRWESSAAGVGEVEPSWERVEVVWVDATEREAASSRRDSASLSEMKLSEKMTSYYDHLVNRSVSQPWRTYLWISKQIVTNAKDMRTTICYAGSRQPYYPTLHCPLALQKEAILEGEGGIKRLIIF